MNSKLENIKEIGNKLLKLRLEITKEEHRHICFSQLFISVFLENFF